MLASMFLESILRTLPLLDLLLSCLLGELFLLWGLLFGGLVFLAGLLGLTLSVGLVDNESARLLAGLGFLLADLKELVFDIFKILKWIKLQKHMAMNKYRKNAL